MNQDMIDACFRLKHQAGYTRKEIAETLGIPERRVKYYLNEVHKKKILDSTISADRISGGLTIDKLGGADDYFSTEDAFVLPDKDNSLFRFEAGDKQREELRQYIENKYKGREVDILNLSDLHIPFTMYKEVDRITRENLDADIVLINGDLFDLFAVSKFAKDKEVALRRELLEGRQFLEFLSKNFEDVIIVEGNHERRLRSFIKNMIPVDMQFLFPDDVLQMVVSGEVIKKKPLKNVHVVGSWWLKIFDVIFAHPDNYSNANLKTVQNTSEYFSIVMNVWHRVCIIGHTHRAGWIMNGEVKQIETGCLCFDMDYHRGSNFTRNKWTRAYTTIHIDEDGRADLNGTVLRII
jgi:predicted phosphodiesterase